MIKHCSTCKFRKDRHYYNISCIYYINNRNLLSESPLYKSSIPKIAFDNGWFNNFPDSFDSVWVGSNCNGYHQL
jgi:hypothetical protein